MNKIKQILIGASIIALSGNAAARIINEDGSKSMILEDMMQEQLAAGTLTVDLEQLFNKAMKKSAKRDRKMARYDAGMGNKRKLKRKVVRLDKKIASLMSELPGSAASINAIIENGGDNGSVPEPSTIALLGLGLVGIGAARRLRKKAR